MTNKKTVTMADESSIWTMDMVDPIVGVNYENLQVKTAEIVKSEKDTRTDTRLRIELQADIVEEE